MRIKKTKIYLALNLMILLCMNFTVWSQTIKISGIVTDEQGLPIPGINIVEKGTKRGTNTDIDGKYNFSISPKSILVFSYVGYENKEVSVNGQTVINQKMKSSSTDLSEVVVVAYGSKKKISVSGAISTISSEQLSRSPSANIANSLAGQITGISTVQSTGRPGADDPRIFIRGIASLTEDGSSPLIIVDGVERSFTGLDPDEIQSLTVLKDASETAVYGVRGANGVIIVTTKRGKTGRASITASYSAGLQQATQLLDFVDSYTYAKSFTQLQSNDGITPDKFRFQPDVIEAFRTNSDPIIYPNTDWLKYILKPFANQSRANVSVSGGNDRVRYFASIGVLSQDGLFKTFETDYDFNFSFQRYNFRTNLDIDVTKSTKLSVTIGGQVGVRNEPIAEEGINTLFRQIYWAPAFSSPGIVDGKYIVYNPIYNRNGSNFTDGLRPFYNRGYNNILENRLNFDLDLNQQLSFVKGLTFGVKLSNNTFYSHTKTRSVTNQLRFTPFFLEDVPNRPLKPGENPKEVVYQQSGAKLNPGYGETQGQDRNWYLESRLNYNRKFGGHNIGGLLLYNQQKDYYPALNTDIPAGLVGIAGRVTYDFKSKYDASVNIGYNGSENFAKAQRFGFFPAVSAGWVVSKEAFIESLPVISFLKIRMTYGVVGNDRIGGGRFLYLNDSFNQSTNSTGYNFGSIIDNRELGAVENKLGNPNVTWEKATKQNLGLDLKLFKDKLGLVLDLFQEDRKDILVTERGLLPGVLGINSALAPAANVGMVQNKGFEIELNWRPQVTKNLGLNINLNLTHSRNKIIFQDEVPRNQAYQFRTGQPVGQPFGRVYDRFFTENDLITVQSDITNNVQTVPRYYRDLKPGDLIYKDLNGDGNIDKEDEQAIGFPDYPQYNFGINMGFNYKNFDFNMSWAGATNTSRLLDDGFKVPFGTSGVRNLLQTVADNSWTPETANTATLPRLSANSLTNNTAPSDFWIRDASYVRLKTLDMGYSFKGIFLKKMGISNFRLYFNANNLITFSKLTLTDPESRTNSAPEYPLTKLYNLGLKFNFL